MLCLRVVSLRERELPEGQSKFSVQQAFFGILLCILKKRYKIAHRVEKEAHRCKIAASYENLDLEEKEARVCLQPMRRKTLDKAKHCLGEIKHRLKK